jgi:6-phosphofructokinase 1
MVADGNFGRMVALRDNRLSSVELSVVANRIRTVPPDSPMIAAALSVGTSFGVPDISARFSGKDESVAIS